MASREYDALTRSEAEVVAAFKQIDAAMTAGGQSSVNIQLAEKHQQPFAAKLAEIESMPHVAELLAAGSAIATNLQLSLAGVKGGAHVAVARKGGVDKVQVNFGDQADPGVAAKLLAVAKKHIPGFEAFQSIEKFLGTELREFYARREQALMRLEGLSQRLIEQNEEYRLRLDDELASRAKKLEEEHAVRLEKAERESAAKEAAVNARAEELENRAKELDDRASRHVRREIRKEFLQKLASREQEFKLSKSTNTKRKPIHILFGLLLIVSIGLSIVGFLAVESGPDNLYAYLRLFVGLAGIAASTVYYIRWADQWFRQHADEEFRLRRLALDFDRASWVVEMALEWKQEKEEEIPRELIDRLTANLFLSGAPSEASRHPAEDIAAALFGASSNLKLNLPNNAGHLSIDKPGKKLA